MSLLLAHPVVAEKLNVDPVHSTVLFRIKHMNTSYAWGRFNDVSGSVDFEGPAAGLDLVVKADSVDTANAKRDEHLRGPDYFNVQEFPTIAFKSTKVTSVGTDKDKTDKFDVEGTLTLHGVSKPIKVQIERTGSMKALNGKAIAGFTTTFAIKRKDFGMKFMLGPLGDEVLLIVSLECAAP